MFISKADQRKYAVLLVLNGVSTNGIKREEIVRQCENNLIIRDKGYERPLDSGGISGQKSLQWTIQSLLKEGMIKKPMPRTPEYTITSQGKQALEQLARRIDEKWATQPAHLILTKKAIESSSLVLGDTTSEDAARVRRLIPS